MSSEDRWFVLALQAEPWAVGPLGVGRAAGGKPYPYMGPNQKVQAYQEAVKGELDGAGVIQGLVEVQLFIWRQIETMKVSGKRDRIGKPADATNIQKATEDAIQGILIENDKNVRLISTHVVEQSSTVTPCIVLRVKPYEEFDPGDLPDHVWDDVDKIQGRSSNQEPLFDDGWQRPTSGPGFLIDPSNAF